MIRCSPRPSHRLPRRSRRGATALLSVTLFLGLGLIVVYTFLIFEAARSARDLAHMAAGRLGEYAYFLDAYVHENTPRLIADLTTNTPRVLNQNELNALMSMPQRPHGKLPPPGWQITHMMVKLEDPIRPNGVSVFGFILATAKSERAKSQMFLLKEFLADKTLTALTAYGGGELNKGVRPTLKKASALAKLALKRATTADETAYFTWPHSGINADYVLRDHRAGHPLPFFETDITFLDGAGITGLANIKTQTLTATTLHPSSDQNPTITLEDMPSASAQLFGLTVEGNLSTGPMSATTVAGDDIKTQHTTTQKLEAFECTGC